MNDQWFEPGDKVMRVGDNTPGAPIAANMPSGLGPKYGHVYCVRHCTPGPYGNRVMIVGFEWTQEKYGPTGWPAKAFRKVDEIKLCINALKNTNKPVAEPA